jgi:hydroxyacylglutathione hydrolase
MTVTAAPIPLLADNYAWLLKDTETGATAVVDPAVAEPCAAAITAAGGRLDLILLTHHHDDHILGTDALRARFGCPVVGAQADVRRLPALSRALVENDAVALGAAAARVIETPGHTRGHIAFFFTPGAVLACGDTLFSLGCGRLLEGTAEEMFASLAKLALLPDETLVCCGHEYTEQNGRFALSVDPDNPALIRRMEEVRRLRAASLPTLPARLGEERAANPFLRAATAAEFAHLRAAKDAFRG